MRTEEGGSDKDSKDYNWAALESARVGAPPSPRGTLEKTDL